MMNKNLMLIGVISLAVSACGGSSSSDTPTPLVAADTAELKNTAAASIGGNFDGNLTAAGTVINRNNNAVFGTVGDVVAGGSDEFAEDIETEPVLQNNIESLVLASLSASEGSEGVTTRTGNTLLIDPDDTELCEDETLDLLGSLDNFSVFGSDRESELDRCTELVKDITVQLVASGESSGEVSYLFQNQTMLKLGYGPDSESVEMDLGGFQTFGTAYNDIYGSEFDEPDSFPSAMTGSFRMSAVTTNSTVGQEAGSVSMDIVNPINIVNPTELGDQSISMATGTLFAIEADANTGRGSLSFDVGAISGVLPSDSGLGRLNLAGFTGKADVNPDNGSLVVSNLGLSRGPLSVSIDNQEVLEMTLQSFGFNVSEQSEQLVIDGNMNLSLMLSSIEGFSLMEQGLANLALNIMAPDGTALARAGNGALQIGGTGPFSLSLGTTNTEGQFEQTAVTINAGECIDEITGDEIDAPSAQKCL